MLALLKKKHTYQQAAESLYARIVVQARQPAFYADLAVPDTFAGRFDLLTLHLCVVIDRLIIEGGAGRDINQALFDATFANMDQTLREIGIGDTGVPKRMKRMMKAFNGRMHAYAEALKDEAALKDTLRRNLYGTIDNVSPQALGGMTSYVMTYATGLQNMPLADILEGSLSFPNVKGE